MDVVYNHLGPAGNYLAALRPVLHRHRTHTPWGTAVNLDDAVLRRGPALPHRQRPDVAARLPLRRPAPRRGPRAASTTARSTSSRSSRSRSTALGQHRAPAALPHRRERPQRSRGDPPAHRPAGTGIDAQWCDDVHHALHADALRRAAGLLRRLRAPRRSWPRPSTRASSTTAAGRASASARTAGRAGRHRGRRSSSPTCRTTTRSATAPPATARRHAVRRAAVRRRRAAAALPFTPMLFMGEEWGARTPVAVLLRPRRPSWPGRQRGPPAGVRRARLGRRANPRPAGPGDLRGVETGLERSPDRSGATPAALVPQLIALRRAEPALTDHQLGQARFRYDELDNWFIAWRGNPDGESIAVAVNLSERAQHVPVAGELLMSSAASESVQPVEGGCSLPAESVAVVRAS